MPTHHHGNGPKCETKIEENRIVASGAKFTCPMHPQVVSDRPGSCPICGMALEPIAPTVAADDDNDRELRDLTQRFWIGAFLALPVLLLAMGEMIPGLQEVVRTVEPRTSLWLQFVLSTPIFFWAGWPFLKKAWQSVTNRSPNMFTLIALGTGAAYLFSVLELFLGAPQGRGHGANAYFEAAAVITVLALLGQVLELRARAKTSSAIQSLLALAPKTAHRLNGDQEEEVPLASIQVGDVLRVRPGDRVPVDGILQKNK